MARPTTWSTSKNELKRLCSIYTLNGVADILVCSKRQVSKKRREFGLLKSQIKK